MSKINIIKIKDVPQFYDITNNNIKRMTEDEILIRELPNTRRGIIQSIFDFVNIHKKKTKKENTQREFISLQRKLSSNILRIEEIKLRQEELIRYNELDIEELDRQNKSILYKLDILREKITKEDEDLNRFENKLFKYKNK
jgi:hypothetical protein